MLFIWYEYDLQGVNQRKVLLGPPATSCGKENVIQYYRKIYYIK